MFTINGSVEFGYPFGSPEGLFEVHLEVLGDPFGIILLIEWGTDTQRWTLKGPRMDFHRFLVDFESPIGHNFGSLFVIFCDLRCQKTCLDCRFDI